MSFKDFIKKKKNCAIDFDGVIHSYHKGWYDGSIYGYVIPGAKEAIDKLKNDYNIIIYTARIIGNPDAIYDIEKFLIDNDIYYDEIKEKIIAEFYIDDRAIRVDPENNYKWEDIWDQVNLIKRKK